jgi:hypothetical protein
MTLSNRALLPDPIIGGRPYALRSGDPAAGLLFYNDEGNESGGLLYSGSRGPGGTRASAGFTLDQFDQDEAVTISHAESNGRRSAGLIVMDRPDRSIQPLADTLLTVIAMSDSAEMARRIRELSERALVTGELGARRVFVGRDTHGNAVLMLCDRLGRPRLELVVDATGTARIRFLDEHGAVVEQLPADR